MYFKYIILEPQNCRFSLFNLWKMSTALPNCHGGSSKSTVNHLSQANFLAESIGLSFLNLNKHDIHPHDNRLL